MPRTAVGIFIVEIDFREKQPIPGCVKGHISTHCIKPVSAIVDVVMLT